MNVIRLKCSSCRGFGMVEGYESVDDCSDCGGSGHGGFLLPSDRIVEYPGGPFRGSYPKGSYKEMQKTNSVELWEPIRPPKLAYKRIATDEIAF